MASMTKINKNAAINQIRHCCREIEEPSASVDAELTQNNYSLIDHHGESARDYYKDRLSELYTVNRKDLNTLIGWVVTAPKELPAEQERAFFEATVDFIENRYGHPEDIVCAEVHMDEPGARSHMHVLMIPTIDDISPLHEEERRVNANAVVTRNDLRSWHDDFQRHISDAGFHVRVKDVQQAKTFEKHPTEPPKMKGRWGI